MGSALPFATAVQIVADQAGTDRFPQLTVPQVERCVQQAAVRDADGLLPSEEDWVETWDVNRAIASAWELKAAEAASRFDMTVDGQTLRRSQVIEHCERQADRFRSRSAFTWPLEPR
jgi:hypothetical protein